MTGLPELPKGGSATAPPKQQGLKVSLSREQLQEMPAWKPWKNYSYGDSFQSWVEWMSTEKSMQSFIWKLSTYESLQLFSAMSQMAWDCHNHHTAFKEKG